jgi:uncharacterized protein YaeQ
MNLYKFRIELSDITRGVYETLDFRVAQHASEHLPYLLTRVMAYALNFQDGLAFAATGLHDPDAAAISIPEKLIIEIGNPSAKKLHKATKSADAVKVYTYKNPDTLMRDLREEKIHRAEEIEFYSIDPKFLEELAEILKKDNRWSLLFDDGVMTIQAGEKSFTSELGVYRY